MTANIAHELRTPVSVIRGELEGMMDGLIPANRESIRSLYAEINRFRTIIEGLEELSQAEASSLSLEKRHVQVKPFLLSIVDRYRRMFEEKGVSIELSCAEEVILWADPDRMSQIVINLLSNALKATEQDGRVEVSAREEGTSVIIEVADTGSGIRQKDLPFIFERFYKGSNQGLGLGLAIAKELVLAHGGTIDARSEYGKGSTFTVMLPK